MLAIGHMNICYTVWILKITRIIRFQYGIFLRQCTFWKADKSKLEFWLDSIFEQSIIARQVQFSGIWQSKRWLGQHCMDSIEWSPCLLWYKRCWCSISQWLQENFYGGKKRQRSFTERNARVYFIRRGIQICQKKLLENNCRNMWTSVKVYIYYT